MRAALKLREGDELVYQIEQDQVIVTKARRADARRDDPFRAFGEWSSEADAKAYADL